MGKGLVSMEIYCIAVFGTSLLTIKTFSVMKKIFSFVALIAALAGVFACNKVEAPQPNEANQLTRPVTKGYGDVIMACYVETNDVNPLNAGDYVLEDGETPFFDIVELFAANIHKDDAGNPTLYLNDKLAPVLEDGGVNTYVRPLQDKGIKVLLTVLGDWQHIGVANMTSAQTTQFAEILAYAVEKYGLDGIGFDDEYADYYSTNSTSYSEIISKLHALMPSNKIITVFDWGNTHTINSAAAACIDYAYHGYFGSYMGLEYCDITGMTNERWSASSLNLGNYNSTSTASDYASRTMNDGYGAMMFFNLRTRNDRDPLALFDAVSEVIWLESVSCDNGNRSRDAGSDPDGYTITYDMATNN